MAKPAREKHDKSEQSPFHDREYIHLAQYAEAGCYPKKKMDGKTLQTQKI